MNRVFILGSGFSKGINDTMPLLGELTEGIKSALQARGIEIGPDLVAVGDVERWLTNLADPSPWLSPAEQMRNSALFSEVSAAIYEVLIAAQSRAAAAPSPGWLFRLVNYWHRTQSTVITFNYDCLVELAIPDSTPSDDNLLPSDLYGIPVTPAALRAAPVYGHRRTTTLKLLKLHGSLSWWYSGPASDHSGAIYQMMWTGGFDKGMVPAWSELGGDLLVTDKFPMPVPPAATKSPFYKNRLLANQWAQAAEALREADELVLMGYSVPITDLTVRTLIATQFKGSTIVPVNPDRDIIERARALGHRTNPPEVIDAFVGLSPLERWTAMFAEA